MEQAQKALKQYFGYDQFRPMQAEIIEAVIQGKDTLVLMPTGGGKSLCYQLPAIILPGTCIVISPLISLMKDQVDGLKSNGVRAAYLNSSQTPKEWEAVTHEARHSNLDLLYVAPETVFSPRCMDVLRAIKINLFAIDEAHCISAWGHDFRPEYTQLSVLRERFKEVPVIALTATADKLTRKDISTQLNLKENEHFVASFDRPNLSLQVLPGRNRITTILRFIRERPGTSGIIYCLSRKSTEELAARLRKEGMKAQCYHAGMSAKQRAKFQQDFINDEVPIICATIAFGMGIDKSNVRWVIHYNLPKNIEGYYQEIGRAGRDGVDSDTLLLYSYRDVTVLREFAEQSGQREVQLTKLNRMMQYAEAHICRRRILLAYFGEHLSEDCGNCDVCKDPPEYLDGTVLAQKAFSAIYRLREAVAMNMLIDVLRGSARKEIREKGYDQIKTYGAGADVGFGDWQHYLLQMLNAGLLEIAYDEGNALKLTPLSKAVLFQQRPVRLYRPAVARQREKAQEKQTQPKSQKEQLRDELFDRLRVLRRDLAQEAGIAPYQIFTDATLLEMAEKRPVSEPQMNAISGVSEAKYQQYGMVFSEAIMRFVLDKRKLGAHIKGSTYIETYALIRQERDARGIAEVRKIGLATVYGHIGRLFKEGYPIDLYQYISQEELDAIAAALEKTQSEYVNDVFPLVSGKVPFEKVRLGMDIIQGG